MSAAENTILLVNPWSLVPDDVTIIFAERLPVTGFCDHGTRTIWIRKGLRQRHRRAVIQHELLHLERGPVFCHWQESEEAAVEAATARALIPLPALLDALSWTRDMSELADELHVPAGLIAVRFQTMKHPAERRACEAAIAEAHAWA